jgi:hypothetical protein
MFFLFGLIFASKAVCSLHKWSTFKCTTLWVCGSDLHRLPSKNLLGTNTLAYFASPVIDKEKVLKHLKPGVLVGCLTDQMWHRCPSGKSHKISQSKHERDCHSRADEWDGAGWNRMITKINETRLF